MTGLPRSQERKLKITVSLERPEGMDIPKDDPTMLLLVTALAGGLRDSLIVTYCEHDFVSSSKAKRHTINAVVDMGLLENAMSDTPMVIPVGPREKDQS